MLPFLLWALWHLHFVLVARHQLYISLNVTRVEHLTVSRDFISSNVSASRQDADFRRRAEMMMHGFRGTGESDRTESNLGFHTESNDRAPIVSRNRYEMHSDVRPREGNDSSMNFRTIEHHEMMRVESVASGLGHLPPINEERSVTDRVDTRLGSRDGVGQATAENWFKK